jgi:hypothetical protein
MRRIKSYTFNDLDAPPALSRWQRKRKTVPRSEKNVTWGDTRNCKYFRLGLTILQSQLLPDKLAQAVLDLGIPRYWRLPGIVRVGVDIMLLPMTLQIATSGDECSNKITTLHATSIAISLDLTPGCGLAPSSAITCA